MPRNTIQVPSYLLSQGFIPTWPPAGVLPLSLRPGNFNTPQQEPPRSSSTIISWILGAPTIISHTSGVRYNSCVWSIPVTYSGFHYPSKAISTTNFVVSRHLHTRPQHHGGYYQRQGPPRVLCASVSEPIFSSSSSSSSSSAVVQRSIPPRLRTALARVDKFDLDTWLAYFERIARDPVFVSQHWQRNVWTHQMAPEPCMDGFVVMADVKRQVRDDYLVAVQATVPDERAGWYMKSVAAKKAPSASIKATKMKVAEMEASLKEGTVVFNSAGGYFPSIAAVSIAAQYAFQLPCNVNMYLTDPGKKVSAPPHTDKQDVFVLQTQGRKHWRVYRPPEPSNKPGVDPYQRGKGPDKLGFDELSEPILDTILEPGQTLYIPGGWPHTTDTLHITRPGEDENGSHVSEASIHLTVGVDTHIWGLTNFFARETALIKAKQPNGISLATLSWDEFQDLTRTAPVGFLANNVDNLAAAQHIAAQMIQTQPQRWPTTSPQELATQLNLEEIIKVIRAHAQTLLSHLDNMYTDCILGVGPALSGSPEEITVSRVKKYMDLIEVSHEAFVQWSKSTTTVAAPSLTTESKAINKAGGFASSGFGTKPAKKKGKK